MSRNIEVHFVLEAFHAVILFVPCNCCPCGENKFLLLLTTMLIGQKCEFVMPGFCNGSLRDEATHAICILCQTTFLRNLSNLLDALWINHASFVLSASKLDLESCNGSVFGSIGQD